MSGFIGDLAIADIDADGQKELIYAVVEKTQDSFSDGKSFIVIQNPPSPGDDTRQ
jgi:dihydropteroate synthase